MWPYDILVLHAQLIQPCSGKKTITGINKDEKNQ